jgi:hypothetical protein
VTEAAVDFTAVVAEATAVPAEAGGVLAGAAAPELLAELELPLEVAGLELELEPVDVTAVAAELTVEVTLSVADVTVEVSELETPAKPGSAVVAAFACREQISRMAMIPAASSAACIARRAM